MPNESDELNKAIKKRVEADLAEVRLRYEEQLTQNTAKITKTAKKSLWSVGALVIAIAVASFILSILAAKKQINDEIISLQKDIIAAHTVIINSTLEIDKSREALSTKRAELAGLVVEVNDLKTKLEKLYEKYEKDLKK